MNNEASIYYLKNPITNEIFYVGATIRKLSARLSGHYAKLCCVKKGTVLSTPVIVYLDNLLPIKADIFLIAKVPLVDIDVEEKYYIEQYSKIYQLTNITSGGIGGDTYTMQSAQRKKEIGTKLSNILKGRAKPGGFSENLSFKRKGLKNPAVKISKYGMFVLFDSDDNPLRLFKYGFEIESFLNRKAVLNNIVRLINTDKLAYGFKWKTYENCSKEIQDIVQSKYESS